MAGLPQVTWPEAMKREDIFRAVLDSADRFGADNPQQFALWQSRLARCESAEVFEGLFRVFVECVPGAAQFPRQKLAGRLLAAMAPFSEFDLARCVQAALPNYNLSVEQLPQFFAQAHGRQAVIDVLIATEAAGDLEEPEETSARTMRWWLGDPSVR